MSTKTWAFEDLGEGLVIDLGTKTVLAREIIEFASEFDAQPFHLDEEAGKASILGGLSASGWHTCSMFMRMLCDALLLDSTSQGAPGIDYAKWKKPVLAGDVLGGKLTILSSRPSRSKPGLGFVSWRAELANQKGEPVFELVNTCMFLTREAAL
ncbi:acyl dehydratase [Aminobacter lissarensis]|uniref:Acyl dehydratase n=1 Tax=Aminobacter carboxidus TaxID=376165 RepID=A0A8E1W902_9HYPH|nr:MaoC family dehydratase [Aminobacter lissarensis]MBB6464206.1 acyl dehydratase [Aminobacter lissarensis]